VSGGRTGGAVMIRSRDLLRGAARHGHKRDELVRIIETLP
jgi:hypothetical protein